MAAVATALIVAGAVAAGHAPVVVAVALALPLVAAVLDRPQRGLLVLAALVPFDGLLLLVPGGGGVVAGWKEALVLVVVAATFTAPTRVRRPSGAWTPPWLAGVVALTGLGIVSAVAVGGAQGALGLKIGFFYLLVALAAWRCPLDERERDLLVTIILTTAVLTAGYGLAQQVLGAGRLNELGYEYNSTIRFAGGYLRSFSTFVQPFPFGFFLMLALIVGLTHALVEPKRVRSTLFLLSVPILLAGLVTTFVRGAWLGLAAGVAYVAVTRHRVLLLALPPVLLSVAFLSPNASSAVLSATSSEERVAGWSVSVSRLVDHPMGEGIGATGATAERLETDDPAEPDRTPDSYQPDNYFVKTAIELGVVGLWLFVLVLLAAFGAARRAQSLPGRDGAFGAATAAFVVAAAVASTVSTFFEIFPLEVYFWLLLSTATGLVGSGGVPGPRRAPELVAIS